MIDPKQVVEGQRIQREAEKCKHPVTEIRDLPNRSYCQACGEDVEPLNDPNTMNTATKQMARFSSVFPVFPSTGE